jgi:hypothetical protein
MAIQINVQKKIIWFLLLTKSMAQISSLDVNNFSASQGNPLILRNLNRYYGVFNNQLLSLFWARPIQSFLHPTIKDVFEHYLPIYAYAFLMGSFLQVSPESYLCISVLYIKFHKPQPINPSSIVLHIWRKVPIVKLGKPHPMFFSLIWQT